MATRASKNKGMIEKFTVGKEGSRAETSGESMSEGDRVRKEMINGEKKNMGGYNGKNDAEICRRDSEVER